VFGLFFWAIRRKGELDYELSEAQNTPLDDRRSRFPSGLSICQTGFDLPRISALVVGLGFLCWPNFAYHLTNVFNRGAGGSD